MYKFLSEFHFIYPINKHIIIQFDFCNLNPFLIQIIFLIKLKITL